MPGDKTETSRDAAQLGVFDLRGGSGRIRSLRLPSAKY